MDGWGCGAYEMRQYTHLANATISKNVSYNILQILSLQFREAPQKSDPCMWALSVQHIQLHTCDHSGLRQMPNIYAFQQFLLFAFVLQEGHVQFHFCVAATSLYMSPCGGVTFKTFKTKLHDQNALSHQDNISLNVSMMRPGVLVQKLLR